MAMKSPLVLNVVFAAMLATPAVAAVQPPTSPAGSVSTSPAKTVDISDLPSATAKAEVDSRLVASASTLHGEGASKTGDDRVICQANRMTGSNIPGPSICATKREWRLRAADAEGFTSDYQQRNRQFGDTTDGSSLIPRFGLGTGISMPSAPR